MTATDQEIAHERAILRTLIGHVAAARGLTPPWPDKAAMPGWLTQKLDGADLSTWGVVELGEVRQRLIPPHRRDHNGVVYTPVEVVNHMVHSALQAAKLDRLAGDPDALDQITIVDPACGCGIFPIHVARYLARWYATQLAGYDPPPDWLTRATLPKVMAECIYGIDLDPVAVDVARAVCWLEIDGVMPITFMNDNLVAANTLADDLRQCAPKLAARWHTPAET